MRREREHAWIRDVLCQACEQDVAFYFKQNSGPFHNSATVLTVGCEYADLVTHEQRDIREYPPLPETAKAARP